ncbi:MAG: flagellar motor switch protein FliN [Pirellulales bacterium]
MADSDEIGQDEIEKLLRNRAKRLPARPRPNRPRSPQPRLPPTAAWSVKTTSKRCCNSIAPAHRRRSPPSRRRPAPESPAAIFDLLFRQAEQALASINAAAPTPPELQPFKLADFAGTPANGDSATLDLLRDVELDLKIELGRTQMYLEDVLRLAKGAVVPLDRLAGDPVDIYVNGRLIARGEVLIMNDNFCVRVAELVSGEQAVA